MAKLTDAQLVILSAAAQRDDGAVLPLPKTLTFNRGAAATVFNSLIKRDLITERPAEIGEEEWRVAETGRRIALAVTDAGLLAIGLNPAKDAARATTEKSSPAGSRPRTKQAALIDLMRRANGAGMAELQDATGWLPHSVRAALSGLRKKGHMIERAMGADGCSVYRIGDGA